MQDTAANSDGEKKRSDIFHAGKDRHLIIHLSKEQTDASLDYLQAQGNDISHLTLYRDGTFHPGKPGEQVRIPDAFYRAFESEEQP